MAKTPPLKRKSKPKSRNAPEKIGKLPPSVLLGEVEEIRQKLFEEIREGTGDRYTVYQHARYIELSIRIIAELDGALDSRKTFLIFWRRLEKAAPEISSQLANVLFESSEAIREWAEKEFPNDPAFEREENG